MIKLRRKAAKTFVVLCGVLAVSAVVAGTALAITSGTGLSTCSPDSGGPGTATVTCTGLIADHTCGFSGATLIYDITAPVAWHIEAFTDDGFGWFNVSTIEDHCEGAPGSGASCTEDGRANTNCSAPEILYCSGDALNFYVLNPEGVGVLHFSVSRSDLPTSVTEQTLIKQVVTTRLYLLPDGHALLVARQPDGKDYFMVFDPSTCVSVAEGAE